MSAITVDQLAPYLTDRGRIEVEFALQSYHVQELTQEVKRLRAEMAEGEETQAARS